MSKDFSRFLGSVNPFSVPAVDTLDGWSPPMPEGTYVASVIAAGERETKQCQDCKILQLVWRIEQGEFAGRRLVTRHNVIHDNPLVEVAGLGQFRRYLELIGQPNPQTEDDLCGVPLLITVDVELVTHHNRHGKTIEFEANTVKRLDPLPSMPQPEA